MTAPGNRYGYDDATLQGIINATETGLQQMAHLNSGVLNIQSTLPVVNNSASGVKLATVIGEWSADFNQVRNQLDALNSKATALLQTNRSADADASAATA
ncbi:hypothetical protein [Actinokineospora inagensis]|uniref:hypothetical protein n=1 Tax=Actinokineospora inagensis TaxID=103730 RepID=UPI0003FD9CDF|nr:hypothetical protein [Actinokineospora inagensis]